MSLPTGVRQIGPEHWEIRARVRNERTGQAMAPKRRVHGSLKEAVAERKAMIAEARQQGGTDDRKRTTLGVFADIWIETRKARGERASTRTNKVKILNQHVLPQFGDWYIIGIRPADVEEWILGVTRLVSERTGKPYRAVTVNSWLRVLKACVAAAYRHFEWGSSPIACVRLLPEAKRSSADPDSLTAEQLEPFLAKVKQMYPRQWAMLFLGFTTGLRWSELSALEWRDLDEARSVLRVERAQVHGKVGGTKTEGSTREIGLVTEQIEVLRDHRRWLLAKQHPGIATGLVFPSRTGTYSTTSRVAQALAKVATALELPFRVTTKAMRRTVNNLLRQRGIDRQVLWSITGHSSEAMTGVYSTVEHREQAEAVARVVSLARATT